MVQFSIAVARMLTVAALMAVAGAAAQDAYPNKPIRIISPYSAGGGTTIMARLIGQKLTEDWGQQVIVENRPGADTIIGSEALVRSPPDGYTLMLTSGGHVTNPSMLALPYDTIKDFTPVATVSISQYTLVVHPSLPVNNLKEFIALAKARSGQLNYGAVGTGGLQHLASVLFDIMTGTRMQRIPYKGSGQILPDLISGITQVAFMKPLNVRAQINSGQLKALAISGETRLSALPQVPTFAEAGLPGFSATNWYWIFGPAGIPKPILDKLSREIAKILAMPDIREKFDAQGEEPLISTPEQFAALIKAEIAKYAKVIKVAKIEREK